MLSRKRKQIDANDFVLAAQACLPIINGLLSAIKNKTHPKNCFLNIDLPTDIANHKVSLVEPFQLRFSEFSYGLTLLSKWRDTS